MTDNLGPYELNTVITGDSRVVARSIPDSSVDLIFTDPPWGIDFRYHNGYKDSYNDYTSLASWIVDESNRILKPGGFAFVYQATKRLREIWQYFPEDARLFSSCKNFIQLRKIPVEYAVDYIVFWQKPGKFKLKSMVKDWHLANTANTANGSSRGVKRKTSPPRPLDTVISIISQMSAEDDIVIDWFLGSGTTAVACKMLNRKYLGIEINTETAEWARERIDSTQLPLLSFSSTQLELE